MMKRTVLIAIVAFGVAGGASAEDGAAWCEKYTQASGVSNEPCACVIETVETEPALADELYSYSDRDEYLASGSEALKTLLAPCVGDVS